VTSFDQLKTEYFYPVESPSAHGEFVFLLGLPNSKMSGRKLPLAMIDKCIGSRIWIIMKG
jgi:hypothetical protein